MAGNPCNIIPDQEIVLEGGAQLVPAPEAADAGKVLGVINQEGGIGWVEDQSGTLVQQQSNWSETDDQSVSFIQNKPDLSVYATTSAMNTALAGKQNTISDLDTIRSGASAGATAVQPSTLESYATTSAMNTALADKQDVISDLATIRSGAEAGATAVQPSSLATVATSGSYADLSNKPTIPSVDQTYSASSTNAQSGVAVADAIAAIPAPSVDEVPAVTSTDDGKVLKASYSGGQGSYAWGTDSDTTYTAGNMIAINANNSNAIGVSTTAGITDIQVVNALPASPVATVLYMIPEA